MDDKEWNRAREELEDCSQHDIKYKTRGWNYKLAVQTLTRFFGKLCGREINLNFLH